MQRRATKGKRTRYRTFARSSTIAVALTLGFLAPAGLRAQPRTGPGPDTPKLLVAVFASNDRTSGVQAADAIRTRITNAVNVRSLYVIPKEAIDNYLTSSGYKSDSALGPSDLKELAKLLRADELLLGTVTRTASGVRIEPRMALARDPTEAQPLPVIEAANANDAARQIERSLADARKQLPDNKACEQASIDNKFPQAIAFANAGIAKYPNATLARLCLAKTFAKMKASPDSVLRVVDEIKRIDPKNSYVYRLAFAVHKERGDNEAALNSLLQLLKLEPTNLTLQGQVIAELATLGKASVALPIIEDLLAQNPGDPQLLRQKWVFTLATAQSDTTASRVTLLSSALTAGEAMVASDTTLADSAYYARQIAAASGIVGQPQKFVEFTSKATQKFPNNPEFWYFRATAERRAGQLQMAQQSMSRVLSINPKYPNASLFIAQVFIEMNQPDSAVEAARRAVASGEDPKTWGTFLIGPTSTAWKRADSTKALPDYEKTLALAQESDKLGATKESKFFVAISSFFIAIELQQQAQKPKSCPLARRAQDMLVLTQVNMPGGGAVDPKTAAAILGYVGQYAPSMEQMVKQYCK